MTLARAPHSTRPKRTSRRARRGGYVLVFFAMIVFGLLALAAVVIDVGLARATQTRMQAATDTAALDGLRFRDSNGSHAQAQAMMQGLEGPVSGPYGPFATPPVDFATGVSQLDPVQAPAGFEVAASGGDSNLEYAHQLVAIGSQWTPGANFQQNDATDGGNNNLAGDVVSGNYTFNGAVLPNQLEPDDYDRSATDFPVANPATAPSLLVRLRRTDPSPRAAPPLLDTEEGSSTGPTLPYIFGHAAFLRAQVDATHPYAVNSDPMVQGIVVRATAIATLTVATSVGWPTTPAPILPLTLPVGAIGAYVPPLAGGTVLWPLAIEDTDWNNPALWGNSQFPCIFYGMYHSSLPANVTPTAALGDPDPNGNTTNAQFVVTSPMVGALIDPIAAPAGLTSPTTPCYVPIYTNNPTISASLVIVGFVRAESTLLNATQTHVTLTFGAPPLVIGPNSSAAASLASSLFYLSEVSNQSPQNAVQYVIPSASNPPVPPLLGPAPLLSAPVLAR